MGRGARLTVLTALVLTLTVARVQGAEKQSTDSKAFDAAAAFGARAGATDMSVSPDGKSISFIRPDAGPGTALMTVDLANASAPKVALYTSGKPDRLKGCRWISNQRLVCTLRRIVNDGRFLIPVERWIAVDRDGANYKMLSNDANEHTLEYLTLAGHIIDWLPDEQEALLMTRQYRPDQHVGSTIGSTRDGFGVDRIDTRTLEVRQVEAPDKYISRYISDGYGHVRVAVQEKPLPNGEDSGVYEILYRKTGAREWLKLSDYNSRDRSGFSPATVDEAQNLVYGFERREGHMALVAIKLDGSLSENVVYARPDADVDDSQVLELGGRNHLVGAYYRTSTTELAFLDPGLGAIVRSLQQALPGNPQVRIEDASLDEKALLVLASGSATPGHYYLYDRTLRQLKPLLAARSELDGVTFGPSRTVQYPAGDGVMLSAELTLPPGMQDAKGLPAIVLPNDGDTSRDATGFDWLAQYFAARGYAVLEPNFRGSALYAQQWLEQNGYKSWRTAADDLLAGGHWLVNQGIANPNQLCSVGWSYGGYVTLQAAVVEPGLFKAIVAIGAATDLDALKESWRGWSNFDEVSSYIGTGPHLREGSPARNADKIKVPVMLFHGVMDREIPVNQSQLMAKSLTAAGVKNELVTYKDADRFLDDTSIRTELLRKSDSFLRQAIGLKP